MAHDAMSMSRVQDPAKQLSQIIAAIKNSRGVFHNNVTSILPILAKCWKTKSSVLIVSQPMMNVTIL